MKKMILVFLEKRQSLYEALKKNLESTGKLILFIAFLAFVFSVFNRTLDFQDYLYVPFSLLVLLLFLFLSLFFIKALEWFGDFSIWFKISFFVSPLLFNYAIVKLSLSIAWTCAFFVLGTIFFLLKTFRFEKDVILYKAARILLTFLFLFLISCVLWFYIFEGFDDQNQVNASTISGKKIDPILNLSPAKYGEYSVQKLTYGSGKDKHRIEYGANVDIRTKTVNGSPFIDNWDGLSGWIRTKYWGFSSDKLPINGRVWYPKENGLFPLVLIVHGDNDMQDFSDEGYEYLGELLASKGMIVISIDENFLNTSWSDFRAGLIQENDARAWLLLQHLKLWHEWDNQENNLFYRKVDTSNIALIGHSRGGESIVHAALFNNLKHYPDNASVKFDFNYNIKALMAIAPVDGQYKPSAVKTELSNINYFVIHGSMDAQLNSFIGSQQYNRITFSDSTYYFKSSLYIKNANHSQFNTTWNDDETFTVFKGFQNSKNLLTNEEQIQIAKVYTVSFLEASLKDNKKYLPLFQDYRKIKKWLPNTIYLSQFEDSRTQILCNYDEDFDLLSTSCNYAAISSENLSKWYERKVKPEDKNKAVFLGWDAATKDELNSTKKTLPTYSISFEEPFAQIDNQSVLTFSLFEVEGIKTKTSSDKENNFIDFTIQLTDSEGEKISFLLSTFSFLQNRLHNIIWKNEYIMGKRRSDEVFQSFFFEFEDLQKENPKFNFSELRKLSFVFNKSENGMIAMDNVGFLKNENYKVNVK
ncbi:MAG: MFS transporter [Bacteroidota bacterium]